jgi:hypothetical protein
MKNLKYIILSLEFWVLGMSMVAQEKAPCSYVPEINGQTIENYALSDFFYDNGSKIYYKLVNDKSSMAVLIKMDKEASRDLFMRGLEIWFNNGNKKKKTDGITFPVPQIPDFDQGQQGGPKDGPEFEIKSSQMEITGFGTDKEQLIAADNPKTIHGSIKPDSNDMIAYQVIIPLDKVKTVIDIEKPFGIMIKSGEFKMPQGGPPMDKRPPMPGKGNGEMPPHGMPGQGGPGMGKAFQTVEIMIRDIIIRTK